jgi:hypothetical protein
MTLCFRARIENPSLGEMAVDHVAELIETHELLITWQLDACAHL